MDLRNESIDLFYVLGVLKRHFILIAALFAIFVVTSGIISKFLLIPQYESTATVIVQSQSTNNNVNDLVAIQQIMKTYSVIIKSQQVAQDVITKLSLKVTTDDLLDKITVTTSTESLVTSITARDTDPVRAAAIANGFADTFKDKIPSIMQVQTVKILDAARLEPKPTPVSPRPLVNIAIAGAAGLLISVGIAFLLEFLDNTIKDEAELGEVLGLPVLGVIATFDDGEQNRHKRNRTIGGSSDGVKSNSGQSGLSA